MNLPYFISKRISNNRERSFSSTIHRIAVASIGVGLAIMIVSFLILNGFQDNVKNKIYSFSSHFLVTKYYLGSSFEEPPMDFNTALYNYYQDYGLIDHVQEYAHKAGMIKTDEEVLGIVFKGVGESYDINRIQDFIVEGSFVSFNDSTYSNQVVLSKSIADKLNIAVGDRIIVHFFQDPPRSRRLTVSGLYETNLSEYFDEKVIIGDLKLIQRLNNWSETTAGGLEVFLKDLNDVEAAEMLLHGVIEHDMATERISDKFIQVFEWLDLIRRQVNIFLGIILVVVCVNMISIIIILIMERTAMIGTLKALGAGNKVIRSIFTFSGIRLIVKGLLLGNALGLGLCYLQDTFHWIKLNPADYYMSFVPIGWSLETVVILNLTTFVIVSIVLLLPTAIISGIQPIKAIRFD